MYTAIIKGLALPTGEKVNVGFKTPGFLIPGMGKTPVDVAELVASEEEKLKTINGLGKSKTDKEKAEELSSELILPGFIGRYVEGDSSSALFDILTDEEAAEGTIKKSKLTLAMETEEKEAELKTALAKVAELEAKLSSLNQTASEPTEIPSE